MDLSQAYHFLFETMPGVGILMAIVLVASVVACALLERRTRRLRRGAQGEGDEWSVREDDEG